MQGIRTIIGYAISDPQGRYPETPEFGSDRLEEARAEARDLNRDFAGELAGGAYRIVILFADGGAEFA
jgi:hypothetical protein